MGRQGHCGSWQKLGGRPTDYGRLGVIDLKLAGFALRACWMWLQKTDGERAWSALQIDFEPEVRALFSASVQVHIGDGWKALFWVDNWVEGRSISQLAPTLMTIISKRTRKQRTVAQALENRQ
jgi:hypothetical protein